MTKSIKFKVWTNLMLLMSLILLIMWLLQVVFLQDFYEFSKESDVKKVQKEIVSTLSSSSRLTDGYEKILETSKNNDIFVEVYDENLNIVISPVNYLFGPGINNFSMENIGLNYTAVSAIEEMVRNSQQSKIIKFKNKQNVRSYIILINKFTNGGSPYFVVTRSALMPVQATSQILSKLTLLFFFIVLFLSLIISVIFAETITKPTRALSSAAHEITSGNYNVQIDYKSGDEMGQLVNEFNKMTQELSKVDSIRKDLIANVSHELRTPLTMIKGYAETLRDLTGNVPEKREKQLNIIVDEADRLSDLITNMLDLSALQAGKTKLDILEFDLSNMIKKLLGRYDIFKDQGYVFNVSIAEGVKVKGDYARLEQVVCNLIDNAVNHSVDNKVIDIDLGINRLFRVRNFGDVIEEENIKHIWDRYYKIDKSGNRRVTGTGIGLSIVKEILTLHGFKFGVTSSKEDGTVFFVQF